MFECEFKDRCVFDGIEDLLNQECQYPEKFDMINPLECTCKFTFTKQFKEI